LGPWNIGDALGIENRPRGFGGHAHIIDNQQRINVLRLDSGGLVGAEELVQEINRVRFLAFDPAHGIHLSLDYPLDLFAVALNLARRG